METNSCDLTGFVERSVGNVRALLRTYFADELCSLGILNPKKFLAKCKLTDYTGRARPLRVNLSSDRTGIVRRYRRGGAAKFIMRDKYIASSRPFEEVRISEHLRSRDVQTTEVLAAVQIREMSVICSGFIVTREILDVTPIRRLVSENQEGREILTKGVPEAFRALHDAGVAHHDLTVDNVLVHEDGTVFLIDLDGCSISETVGTPRRLVDLMRFRRSAHKNSLAVSEQEWRVFFRSYAGDNDALLEKLESWLNTFDRRLFWYKIGWKLGI